MGKFKDLTGQQINYLTVICKDIDKTKEKKRIHWLCKCVCGKEISVSTDRLNKGQISCGCQNYKPDTTSLIGKKFNRLLVKSRDMSKEIGHGKEAYWICECDCGNEISVRTTDIVREHTKSCGCIRAEQLIQRNLKDLTNMRFGKIVALYRTEEKSSHNSYIWYCQCDCGKEYLCSAENLLSGKINSCGCNKTSYGEQKIQKILLENNITFNKEFTFSDLVSEKGQLLRYDFAIFDNTNNIIRLIEFDGEQHYNIKSRYYSEIIIEHDIIKNNYAKEKNIPLVRIPYNELPNLSYDMLMNNDKYLV